MVNRFFICLLLGMTLPLCGLLRAADKPTEEEEREAKEAAEEDKIASEMDVEVESPLLSITVTGTLYLDPSAKGDVVGRVSSKQGIFLLKLENKALMEKLVKLNGKEVTLGGKLRNNGKYLIAKDLFEGVQPSVNYSDPRGL